MLSHSKVPKFNFHIFSAIDLWQKETSLPSIPTFSQNLDKVLGNNGIELGSITELLGLSGTGKTQLCLQLCCAVQIPQSLGGLDAEALYIDTNTNFTIDRFQEILFNSYSKWRKLLDGPQEENIDNMLKKLHYIDGYGLENFCAILHQLPVMLNDHTNVKLIVIDSIVFPFKAGISEKKRTGLLFRQMGELQRLAVDRQIAVVLTNEMSTRLGLSGDQIVGSLGDAWAHRCNKRVLLSTPKQHECERVAVLIKSNNSPEAVAHFQITEEGIRDID